LTNLLALPGLGTFLAGRRWAGVGQALLAIPGFVLTLWWFDSFVVLWWRTRSLPWDGGPRFRYGLIGVGLFFLGWVWALMTGLEIKRQKP
jgi:hypothetical protein